jgi:hypothetical protein
MTLVPLTLPPICALALLLGAADGVDAEEQPAAAAQLARHGAGAGPRVEEDVLRLLDDARTPGQVNSAAFDRAREGAFERVTLTTRVRVLEGGDGGSVLLLSTAHHGARGPAPFLPNAVEPNLAGTFAVGLDVHNPPSKETFTRWGNYQDLPQREVSLHHDGRELVKRVAPVEFRGDFAPLEIVLEHVIGGAEVTVTLAGARVYERWFVANLAPYECRLAFAAGTRADAATQFDVEAPRFVQERPAAPRRPPVTVELFHHVLTDNSRTAFTREAALPPHEWAFGRVLLELEIHDAGEAWDEWDRNGELSVVADDGTKLGIVPFITSYRTPCRWVVDVTHFRPLLAGTRRFELAAGTTFYKNRGYLMSASLAFHHGVPAEEPARVVPLWVGTAHHRSAENHFRDFFAPRRVTVDPDAVGAKVWLTTTGHSQVGEFTPSKRTLVFAPRAGEGAGERRFENLLWKTDVYLNPNRPQFGTWQFSRAGWAPGDVVHPWWIDLSEALVPGAECELRYEPAPYEFPSGEPRPSEAQVNEASHVVRGYLITYRRPTALVPAPILRVADAKADGAAARAGVRAGDYLASYDGVDLVDVEALRSAIQAAEAGAKSAVTLVVYRGSERLEMTVPPGLLGVQLQGR